MSLLEMKPSAKDKPRASVIAAQLSDLTVADEYTRVRAWLDDKVAAAEKAPIAEAVTLTPALAEVLLNRNPNNRPISRTLVENLSRDIRSDAFLFNGEPIIIAKDGTMNDGQHRCTAVLETGLPIRTMFVFGVPRESRTTVDQNKVRTVGDYLGMDGHQNGAILAALANMWLVYSQWGVIRNRDKTGPKMFRPTKSEIKQAAEDNSDFQRAISLVPNKNLKLFGGRTAVAFLILVLARRSNWTDSVNFVETMVDGAGLPKNSPILYARTRLVIEGARLKHSERMELIFRAWNAHRLGQTPNRLHITGGKLPILER